MSKREELVKQEEVASDEDSSEQEIEDEDTLHLMLAQQFKSILSTESQLKGLIHEKDTFKKKAMQLDTIAIRSELLMDAVTRVIDSFDYIESETAKCRSEVEELEGKSATKSTKQTAKMFSEEELIYGKEQLINKLKMERSAKQIVLHQQMSVNSSL